jgi:hypothetical protein
MMRDIMFVFWVLWAPTNAMLFLNDIRKKRVAEAHIHGFFVVVALSVQLIYYFTK